MSLCVAHRCTVTFIAPHVSTCVLCSAQKQQAAADVGDLLRILRSIASWKHSVSGRQAVVLSSGPGCSVTSKWLVGVATGAPSLPNPGAITASLIRPSLRPSVRPSVSSSHHYRLRPSLPAPRHHCLPPSSVRHSLTLVPSLPSVRLLFPHAITVMCCNSMSCPCVVCRKLWCACR
jgi:hypothetical protein